MKSKKIRLILLLTSFALVLATVGGVTLAKYVFGAEHSETVEPEPFYFSCNYDDGGIYYLPSNSTSVMVYNHNNVTGNLKVNPEDITYTITYQKTNGEGGAAVTSDPIILSKSAANEHETVIAGSLGDNYHVTVTSSVPYVRTIEFDLIFMEEDATSFYTVTKSKDNTWMQLDVYIGMKAPASLTIDYGTLAPDNTNPFMRDWLTANKKGTIERAKLSDHAHYTFIFFGDVTSYSNVTKAEAKAPTDDGNGNLTIEIKPN